MKFAEHTYVCIIINYPDHNLNEHHHKLYTTSFAKNHHNINTNTPSQKLPQTCKRTTTLYHKHTLAKQHHTYTNTLAEYNS